MSASTSAWRMRPRASSPNSPCMMVVTGPRGPCSSQSNIQRLAMGLLTSSPICSLRTL